MRILALITAHNEAAVIQPSLDALTEAGVRPDDILVLADRCTDETARIAREAGANVREREDGPPGKGAALAWLAPTLEEFDAVLVLDADSRLQPGTLEAITRSLDGGADAVQVRLEPVPEVRSPASVLAAFSEWADQAIGDRLRGKLGWPVPLRGTGMALRTDVFRELTPKLKTSVEDLELTILLARAGKRIHYVSDGIVEDPKPSGIASVARQRGRWLRGRVAALLRYAPSMILTAIIRGPGAFFLMTKLSFRPRSFFLLLKAGILVLCWWLRAHPAAVVGGAVAGFSLLGDIVALAGGLIAVPSRYRGAVLRALTLSPLYLVVWAWAAVLGLFSRNPWLRARPGS